MVTEADELQHVPGDDRLWRESLYFSFHDAGGQLGGMTTLGILPNQNRVQGYAAIFPGNANQILLSYTEHRLAAGEAGLCHAPGTTYEMLAPLQKWRLDVTADFARVDPYQIVPGAGAPRITVPAGFNLTFEALSPAYEFPPDAFGLLAGAARHFEQTGHITGSVSIDGRRFNIDGFGFRDHSWGIRDLSKAADVLGVCAQFGPHLTVNGLWGTRERQEISIGYISRDGVNTPINDLQVALETDHLSTLPKAAQAEIGTVDGSRLTLQAEMISVIPVLLDHGKDRLYWYECSARFRHGGQTGYGTVVATKMVRSC